MIYFDMKVLVIIFSGECRTTKLDASNGISAKLFCSNSQHHYSQKTIEPQTREVTKEGDCKPFCTHFNIGFSFCLYCSNTRRYKHLD